jgi:23S rRNA C2498 (ribose-2'-O)-methylase RlmM
MIRNQPKTNAERYHLALMRPGFESALKEEFLYRFGIDAQIACRAGVSLSQDIVLPEIIKTVFVRQYLPRALQYVGNQFEDSLKFLCDRMDVMLKRDNRQEGIWTLHAFAIDNDAALAIAKKLSKGLLSHLQKKHPNFFRRYLPKDQFLEEERSSKDFICQIYCPTPGEIWFSNARIQEGVSLYEAGFRPMRILRHAPSRSASKLEEALLVIGRHPTQGDTAVDLGAAPGGWSLVLARHGARVEAIDHGELKLPPKLKLKGQIHHVKANGLKFMPNEPVTWMVCDMVMAAEETLKVLKKWALAGAMSHFVVNIKLSKEAPWKGTLSALELIKNIKKFEIVARHLTHDRSEITLIGYRID